MPKLNLSQNKFALVDEDDFKRCSLYTWWYDRKTESARTEVDNKTVILSRFILREPEGIVDHKDFDRLNCRRRNLRICNATQSSQHRRKWKTKTSSIYKGVTWHNKRLIFQAYICINGKLKFLGSFQNEIEAALKYNKIAKLYFGEFAELNNIKET